MAKLAIVIKNKAANVYHADRPLHSLLVDGTQAGITATKNAGAGSVLLGAFGPNGGSVVADWKTAPWGAGPARNTQYSGGAIAIGSVTGWAVIETPHCWRLIVETAGPLACTNSFKFGEVIIAHDSTMGESATYGNADGRTIYGMMSLAPGYGTGASLETYGTNAGQSQIFIGAETARHRAWAMWAENTALYSATYMVPAGYGSGDLSIDGEMPLIIEGASRIGYPSYDKLGKVGAHYSARTIGGQVCRVIGGSITVSTLITSPYRKPGASADTLVFSRTVAAYATWGDFLQAVWDYFAGGTYWEQDSSA